MMEREIERQISATRAVTWSLYQSVMVKEEHSQKAKISIYQLTMFPR